jgi:hypothetical protein
VVPEMKASDAAFVLAFVAFSLLVAFASGNPMRAISRSRSVKKPAVEIMAVNPVPQRRLAAY